MFEKNKLRAVGVLKRDQMHFHENCNKQNIQTKKNIDNFSIVVHFNQFVVGGAFFFKKIPKHD